MEVVVRGWPDRGLRAAVGLTLGGRAGETNQVPPGPGRRLRGWQAGDTRKGLLGPRDKVHSKVKEPMRPHERNPCSELALVHLNRERLSVCFFF